MGMNDMTLIAGAGMALTDAVRVNRHWIGGAWVSSVEQFDRVFPSHGVVVSRSAKGDGTETETAIAAARAAIDGSGRLSGEGLQ